MHALRLSFGGGLAPHDATPTPPYHTPVYPASGGGGGGTGGGTGLPGLLQMRDHAGEIFEAFQKFLTTEYRKKSRIVRPLLLVCEAACVRACARVCLPVRCRI